MKRMLFYTNKILTVPGPELVKRSGLIQLDEEAYFPEDPGGPDEENISYDGPLHIESGLKDDDFIVFLGRSCGTRQLTLEAPTAYLVTCADELENGAGTLVGLDEVRQSPETWMQDRVLTLAHRLDSPSLNAAAEIGIPLTLIRYIESRRIDVAA